LVCYPGPGCNCRLQQKNRELDKWKNETGKDKIISIAEILDNPEPYRYGECTVSGYVISVIDVPDIKLDVFKIFDGTDEIWIYTNRGTPPLYIRGRVKGTLLRSLDISLIIPIIKIPIIPEIRYIIILKEFKFKRNENFPPFD
jgi:hypothetical protein